MAKLVNYNFHYSLKSLCLDSLVREKKIMFKSLLFWVSVPIRKNYDHN